MKKNSGKKDKIVLVGVVKRQKDLALVLSKKWYRIPTVYAVKRQFDYLAFYQPALFGQEGKCIRYYAPVLSQQTIKRKKLLPEELGYPQANNYYLRFRLGPVKKLARPIKNIAPRRISFGFTTLNRLLLAKNILGLYNIAPTEQIVEQALRRAQLKAKSQHYVLIGQKRYFLDFALFCKEGRIAVECDNKKAHSSPRQRERDKAKNTALGRAGWAVIRLSEEEIISALPRAILKVKKTVRQLGGLS